MAASTSSQMNFSTSTLNSDRERYGFLWCIYFHVTASKHAKKMRIFGDFRWVCIYPAYINSKKTRQEGRKVRKDLCVENPTYQEIKDVLSVSNLRIGVENKLYSRERSKVR